MISEEFKKNVEARDVRMIKSALLDYLIIDKSGKKFDEAFEYANTSVNLLEDYDGSPFENDPSKWNEDYLNAQKVSLMLNFSERRIVHVKKVVKAVLADDNTNVERIEKRKTNGKTGRQIISEVESGANDSNVSSQTFKNSSYGNSKTGRKTVSEKTTTVKSEKQDVESSFLIGGGLTVAVVGAAVGISGLSGWGYVALAVGGVTAGVGIGKKVSEK